VIATVCIGRSALVSHPRHCGCYSVYAEAGRAWLAGLDVYSSRPGLLVFRYAPIISVILAPMGAMHDILGIGILRTLNLFLFLGGLYWWGKHAAPEHLVAGWLSSPNTVVPTRFRRQEEFNDVDASLASCRMRDPAAGRCRRDSLHAPNGRA